MKKRLLLLLMSVLGVPASWAQQAASAPAPSSAPFRAAPEAAPFGRAPLRCDNVRPPDLKDLRGPFNTRLEATVTLEQGKVRALQYRVITTALDRATLRQLMVATTSAIEVYECGAQTGVFIQAFEFR